MLDRGQPRNLIEKLLSGIKFTGSWLQHLNKTTKKGTESTFNGNTISTINIYFERSFTQKMASYTKSLNQPLLRQIFKQAPILSNKKGTSLKDVRVRAKIKKVSKSFGRNCAACHPFHFHTFIICSKLFDQKFYSCKLSL